jgi:hypothetical protein
MVEVVAISLEQYTRGQANLEDLNVSRSGVASRFCSHAGAGNTRAWHWPDIGAHPMYSRVAHLDLLLVDFQVFSGLGRVLDMPRRRQTTS